jgi:hypothetical protein
MECWVLSNAFCASTDMIMSFLSFILFTWLVSGNWDSIFKRLRFDFRLSPYAKINSKWNKNLNTKPETMNFQSSNATGKIRHWQWIFECEPKSTGNKGRVRQMGIMTLKIFLESKGRKSNSMKRQDTQCKKKSASCSTGKQLIPWIRKSKI